MTQVRTISKLRAWGWKLIACFKKPCRAFHALRASHEIPLRLFSGSQLFTTRRIRQRNTKYCNQSFIGSLKRHAKAHVSLALRGGWKARRCSEKRMSRANGCGVRPFVRNITLCREDYVVRDWVCGDARHMQNGIEDCPEAP